MYKFDDLETTFLTNLAEFRWRKSLAFVKIKILIGWGSVCLFDGKIRMTSNSMRPSLFLIILAYRDKIDPLPFSVLLMIPYEYTSCDPLQNR